MTCLLFVYFLNFLNFIYLFLNDIDANRSYSRKMQPTAIGQISKLCIVKKRTKFQGSESKVSVKFQENGWAGEIE